MKDEDKTKKQLIKELTGLRQRIAELERIETKPEQVEETVDSRRGLMGRIVETSPVGITIVNREGQITFANTKAEEILGLTKSEITGRTYNATDWRITDYNGNPFPDERLPFQQVMATKQPVYDMRHAIERPDGRRVLLSINGVPLLDETGQVDRVVFAIENVTERVQTKQALQESEKRFRGLFEGAPDAIILTDPESGQILDANPAASQLLLRPREEIIGLHHAQLHPPERKVYSQDTFIKHVQRTQLGEKTQPIENLVLRSDGNTTPVEILAQMIHLQGKPVLQSTFRDITERKRVEETLLQRNRELAMLNQAGQVLTSTLDLDRVLATVLKEIQHLPDVLACSIWLVDPETNELVCRQVTEPQSTLVRGWRLAPEQGLAGWVVKHKQSLNVPDAQTDKRHFKGVNAKTGLKLRSILTVPLQVKEKVIGVMQVVDEDVGRFTSTHQTLLESLAATAAIAIQNAQWYEQARQDAETKLALLHEVNHRIKNNLTAIIGLLYAERHHAKVQGRTYQDILNNLINRVQGLATVHELLSASEWRSLPLSDLAWQIIHAALQVLSPPKQVFVNVYPSSLQVSPTQANYLAVVINELATNSIKYAMPERDKVQITVSITLEENMIRFQFQDNGPGYPEEVLKSEQHDVGLYLIQTIVHSSLQGEVILDNDQGAITIIRFKMME